MYDFLIAYLFFIIGEVFIFLMLFLPNENSRFYIKNLLKNINNEESTFRKVIYLVIYATFAPIIFLIMLIYTGIQKLIELFKKKDEEQHE